MFGLGDGDGNGDGGEGVLGVGEGLVVTACIIVRVSHKRWKAGYSAEQPDCAAMHIFLHDFA